MSDRGGRERGVVVAKLGVVEFGGLWDSLMVRMVAGQECGWESVMSVLVALDGCYCVAGKGRVVVAGVSTGRF